MKRLTLIPLIAILAFSACDSHDTEPSSPSGDAINFDAEVSTRGVVTTQATIENFGVFCYYTGDRRWAQAGIEATPNKLYNTKVSKEDNGMWNYENPVKWTDLAGNEVGIGYFFHFFGYSPYVDTLNSTDIELNTVDTTPGAPLLTYRQSYNINNQTDLLVASPINDMMHIGNRVRMVFYHALSQISFSACIADAKTGNIYTVTQLSLTYHTDYGNIYRKAIIDLGTLQWSSYDEAVEDSYEEYIPMNGVALTTNFQNLQSTNNSLFYIPQEVQREAIGMALTVQKKPSSGNASTLTFSNIPVPATLWELGKSYNYQYTISYETKEISLSGVNIVDWTTSSGGSMDTQ